MSNNNPDPAPVEINPLVVSYKDRSLGLTVFGVMTILLGCLSGLMVPLMLFGMAMSAKTTGAPTPASAMLPGLFLYGGLAVALVWLGVGSIMARRWARALLLIFSSSWLFFGVIAMIAMAIVIPVTMKNLPHSRTGGNAAMGIVFLFMFFFLGFFFVLLPGVWIFFYQSRHVKATCAARDPVTRWTDTCPLPVLAMSLWMFLGMFMMLLMPIAAHGVMPFFGMFLSGIAGTAFCLVLAIIWGLSACLLYRLDVRGWWFILVALCVFTASALVTYARCDLMDMYRLMGYGDAQIQQLQQSGLLTSNSMGWVTGVSMGLFMAYLLFIKKYFRRPA